MMKNRIIFLVLIISFVNILFVSCHNKQKKPYAKRVILIGIDGMGTDGFQTAVTSNLDELVHRGALSMKTRGVMPTVSGPNWGSILTGAGPEQHGFINNNWTVKDHTLEPTIKDEEGYFPSIFYLIETQRPELKTAFLYDWDALGNYINPSYIDDIQYRKGYFPDFDTAIQYIVEEKPDFTFLYIGYPDEVGHEHQWGSFEYYQALTDIDKNLGKLFSAMKEKGIFEETCFIVVTDHGGVASGHGGNSIDELQIPWIISGPGIIQDKMIEQTNDLYNTSPTIAYLFGLEIPEGWIGKPVWGSFWSHKSVYPENVNSYIPKPKGSITSGIYTQSQIIEFYINSKDSEIRYTLDGREPIRSSQLYSVPFVLDTSVVIRAKAFEQNSESLEEQIRFIRVFGVDDFELQYLYSSRYSASGKYSLFDGQIAGTNYKDGNWLGFEGDDMIGILDFGSKKSVTNIKVSHLSNIGSWIFPPKGVSVFISNDGKKFMEVSGISEKVIFDKGETNKSVIVVSFHEVKTRYLKIVVRNQGVCPPGHPGEGSKAWLFIDEIIIE